MFGDAHFDGDVVWKCKPAFDVVVYVSGGQMSVCALSESVYPFRVLLSFTNYYYV